MLRAVPLEDTFEIIVNTVSNCHHAYIRIWKTWWRHQIETFSALLAICAGNSPVNDEFPAQRPVTRSFDVFFDLRRNKRLSKQSRSRWFETLSRPLWRHSNGHSTGAVVYVDARYRFYVVRKVPSFPQFIKIVATKTEICSSPQVY